MPDGFSDLYLKMLEVNAIPFQREEFADPKPRRSVQKSECSFAHLEVAEKSLDLVEF